MKKSLGIFLISALSSLFLVAPSPASAATVTGIFPSKLEVESVGPDYTNEKPLLTNLVDVSNRGLIDGNQYVSPSGMTADFIQLTFGPFAQGNSNRIPDGNCLSSLTLSVTADLTGSGIILYYWNKARMSVGKSQSVVRSIDSVNTIKNGKVGQTLAYNIVEGDNPAWGTTRSYRSTIAATSGDVTRTHDIGIQDLSTKDLNDGNFVVTVSAINSTDILKNVSLSYVSTNVGCKTPVTISSVTDSKEFDDSATATAGKVPLVTAGTLAAGDGLDPATCVQTFNTKTIGTNKGLDVNRGCKILDTSNPSAPVDNTANYEISWAAALGTVSAASAPSSGGSSGSSGGGSSVTYRSVTFDANGGTGTTPAVSNYTTTALPAHSLVKPGFVFTGWNTKADGTGIAYADKATYPFTSDVTLYAQWVPVKAAAKVKQYISTFAGDKATLTPKMRATIAGWVKKLPKDSVITCQGSTSGSKVTAFDKRLASNRAKNVCVEAVKRRSDLTYSIQLNPSSATKVSARHVWMIQN